MKLKLRFVYWTIKRMRGIGKECYVCEECLRIVNDTNICPKCGNELINEIE